MESIVVYLNQVFESLSTSLGGAGMLFSVVGVLVMLLVVWGVYYNRKQSEYSPFEQL
jgi:hypothetical protein